MKQILIAALLLIVMFGAAMWFLRQAATEAPAPTPTDETDTAADVTPPAEPAASPTAPTNAAAQEYVGLTEAAAAALAEERGVLFRVVERDGEMLPVTRDYRPGRINAVVEDGVVVSYTVEGQAQDKGGESELSETAGEEASAGAHDAIIGLTVAEAEAYAEAQNVPFRVGSVDGEVRPVTMDYRPGRITASVVDGVVTDYSVE